MSEYVKMVREAGDAYLAALAEGQKTFLKGIESIQSSVPSYPPYAAYSMPAAPAFSSDFPTLQEITEANYSFASKLLKQQKEFADQLFSKMPSAASASPSPAASAAS